MKSLSSLITPRCCRRVRMPFRASTLSILALLLPISFAQQSPERKAQPTPTQMPQCKTAQGRAEIFADKMMLRTESAAASVRQVKGSVALLPSPTDTSQKALLQFLMNMIDIYKSKARLKFGNSVDFEDKLFEKRMSQFTPGTPQWIAVYKSLTAGAEDKWMDAYRVMSKDCGL